MLNSLLTWFESRYREIELAPNPHPPSGLWVFLSYFIGQFRGAVALRLLLVGLGSVADAALPLFLGLIVGMLASVESGQLFAQKGMVLLLMAATIALRPVSFVLDTVVRNQALIPPLIDRTRWQSHWHVMRQSWNFFQNDFAGRIANKVMQTGDAIETALNLSIDAVWYTLVFVVVATGVLISLDPLFLIPIGIWAGLYAVLLTKTFPAVQRHSELSSEAKSQMTGRIVDCYTNVQTLKTFATGGREDAYVAESVSAHTVVFRKLMRVFATMWGSLFVINAGLLLATSWMALDGWNRGALSTQAVAIIIPFVLQIINVSGWILDVGSTIFRNIGTARDSMLTIARPLTMVDEPQAPDLVITRGEIAFRDVSFNYWKGDSGQVIDGFNLTVAPGQKVGLVGRSGAGKSTLVNLLLRLFDVEKGAVLIDGQDVRNVTQESLRHAIGLVSQDTSLLHRSIRDNIKYGRPEATDAEMVAAAEKARVHDVIMGLVDQNGRRGYDAHVGERGIKLSGGQRQRVAIARVLLKDAPILLLDEATSALDSEVEAAIQEQLADLMRNKTVIAIAHRLSTIAAMDHLITMDKGKVVEAGTHGELVALGGHYARLWARQSGGFLDMEAEDGAAVAQ